MSIARVDEVLRSLRISSVDINALQREFSSKLVSLPIILQDEWIVALSQELLSTLPPAAADAFNKINKVFSSQVDVLNLYAEYYTSRIQQILLDCPPSSIVNPEQFVQTPISDMQAHIELVKLLFSNIYNHLKFLLLTNVRDLCNTYAVAFPSHFSLPDFPTVVLTHPQPSYSSQCDEQIHFSTQPSVVQHLASTSPSLEPFRAPRNSLDKRSKSILKNWFSTHIQYPYPSETEKTTLAQQCNISVRQLNTWFANYRSRTKKRMLRRNDFQLEE